MLYQEMAICLHQADAGRAARSSTTSSRALARALIERSLDICRDFNARAYPSALNRAGRIFAAAGEVDAGLQHLDEGSPRRVGSATDGSGRPTTSSTSSTPTAPGPTPARPRYRDPRRPASVARRRGRRRLPLPRHRREVGVVAGPPVHDRRTRPADRGSRAISTTPSRITRGDSRSCRTRVSGRTAPRRSRGSSTGSAHSSTSSPASRSGVGTPVCVKTGMPRTRRSSPRRCSRVSRSFTSPRPPEGSHTMRSPRGVPRAFVKFDVPGGHRLLVHSCEDCACPSAMSKPIGRPPCTVGATHHERATS